MFASVITTETFRRQCQYATAEFVFLYIIVIFPGQQRTHLDRKAGENLLQFHNNRHRHTLSSLTEKALLRGDTADKKHFE